MHSECSVAERLHSRAHVVLHEDAAVTAPLIPVRLEPIAVLERSVGVVAVIHHQTMTGPVQAVEQAELFSGPAQSVARGEQYALRDRHADPRIEVPLQDSVITPRLIAVVAL